MFSTTSSCQCLTSKHLAVYESDGRLHATFLTSTQSVLRNMADLGTEIEEIFILKKNCAVTGISRVVANVHLSYQQVFNRSIRRKPLANLYPTYQCIILAIRPLLLRLLEIHLKASGRLGGVDGKLSESVKALLQTCVDAARKILGILLALRDHNLLRKPASSTLSFQGPNTSQRVFCLSTWNTLSPRPSSSS